MSTNTLVFKTTPAGLVLNVDIYSPPGDQSASAAPIILWFHAGGLLFGDTKTLFPDWLVELARKSGWTVAIPEYRLVPEATIDQVLEDVKDIWSYTHTSLNDELKKLNLPLVDTSRVFSTGGSAGGYLALQLGHLVSPPPRGIATFYGYPFDSEKWFRTPLPSDTLFIGQPIGNSLSQADEIDAWIEKAKKARTGEDGAKQVAGSGRAGQDPTRPALLLHYLLLRGKYFSIVFGQEDISPSHKYLWPHKSITSSYPPSLLLHGKGDLEIPYSESEVVADALEKAGVEHEIVLLEDRRHGFDVLEPDFDNVKDSKTKFWDWITKHA